jgi:hypothetical protein|nr:MAG TPA: hypothetical protein [Caudoviricetes sp.]
MNDKDNENVITTRLFYDVTSVVACKITLSLIKVHFPCAIDYDDLVKSMHGFKIIYPRIRNNDINDEE